MARKSAQPRLRVVVDLALLATDAGAELRIYRDDALLSRRRFQRLPATCDDRRDAVALTIALALEDPAVVGSAAATTDTADGGGAAAQSGTSSSVQTLTVPTASGSQPTVETAQAAQQPAPAPAHTEVSSGADSDKPEAAQKDERQVILGSMPSSVSHSLSREPGLGFRLQLGVRWITAALPFSVWAGSLGVALVTSEHFSIAVSALASTAGETSFATGTALGRLYGLEAIGCSSLGLGPAALELCAGAAAAACDVSGRDYPMARPDTTLLWAAGLARVALRWPAASTFSVRLFAQGHINISRPTLEVERATSTLKPGWIGMTAGLELVLSLH
jgi:hypothetical protein